MAFLTVIEEQALYRSHPTFRRVGGAAVGVCAGLVLGLGSGAACAAAMGGLANSFAPLATLAALLVVKAWPTHLSLPQASAACAALLMAGGVAWWWRAGSVNRGVPRAVFRGQVEHLRVPAACSPSSATEVVLPDGFERDTLLAELRRQFVLMQVAWDRVEIAALRDLTTPEMLEELCLELPHATGVDGANRTEIIALRAELLGFEALAQVFVASVEFSGSTRDFARADVVAFRELWLLTRSRHEVETWRLARHQALI